MKRWDDEIYLTNILSWFVGAAANDEGPVELSNGRIVGRRWKIIEKLGEGGCGSVYKVQDIQTLAKVVYVIEIHLLTVKNLFNLFNWQLKPLLIPSLFLQ